MSHDHCHEGSCSVTGHHHHHHGECCHGSHDTCCHHHEHEDFAHELLDLADEAWMEVLKEKIKDQIRENNGKHLDALAKLVAESNNVRWKNKLSLQNTWGDFKAKVDAIFKK